MIIDVLIPYESVASMPPAAPDHIVYRPEIDGLRAIAVLAVVIYHAAIPGFSGGFVGVDIFFVISGYLITSIIAKDISLKTFTYASFYERRIRRIFPALFAMAFFFTVAAVLFLPPDKLSVYAKSLIAMTLFGSNVLFWKDRGPEGYFDTSSQTEPLLHTWTLGVEEQFYLLFPIFMIALSRTSRESRIFSLLVFAAGSFCLSIWATSYKPFAAFYLLPFRGWELLIGSILAVGAIPAPKCRATNELLGLCGLFLIAWAIFGYTPFPGLNALFPCAGTWLIIYSCAHGPSLPKSALSVRYMVFVGTLSYSIYLWHWPLLVFGRVLRVCPETSGWIAEFSEHEAD
jgi:peptidoglycan/LPS O-acetylase OafA/YrhL